MVNWLLILVPPKIVNFLQEYKVAAQQSVTLQCQAKGYPEPTFTWRPCKDSCNAGTLTILEVLNDTVYTCAVTDSEGNDTANASVGRLPGFQLRYWLVTCIKHRVKLSLYS